MKKLFLISIGTLLIGIIGYKTVLTPHLIPTANKLTKLIVKKESSADCTCWSTVRIMEFHQTELPLSNHAMALKIEIMKTLLWNIWQTASKNNHKFEEELNNILSKNTHWLTSITAPVTPDHLIQKTQKYHYHQLTEHYRYLLSIIYDVAHKNINPKELNELNNKNIEQLATISTHLNTELLSYARKSAILNHHHIVTVDDLKYGFETILNNLSLSDNISTTKKTSPLYFFWLKRISKKIIENKTYALIKYNDSIWNTSISTEHQAKLLSQIFKYKISKHELQLLIKEFIKTYKYLFYPNNDLRIDTLQKPILNKMLMNEFDYGNSIITFQEQFHQLNQTFPFLLHKNGDIEIKYKNRLKHQKKKHLHHYTIRSFTLDSVRDTVTHWTIMEQIQKSYRTAILDPFALELLAERISEYIALILTITKENSTTIQKEFQKNTIKKSFLQINEIKSTWNKKNTLKKQNYFKQIKTFKTSQSNHLPKNTKGYYSGISTVDINNDNRIDIIVPEENKLTLYLNNIDGFKEKTILKSTKHPINAVYAIDFNNDYRLDLIAVIENKVLFLEQTSNTQFRKTTQLIMEKAFSMCTNDIDNDGDLDFYITQINTEEPALGGKNGSPNKLIINNNKSFNITNIPAIESTSIGLACSIIDLSNDNKKDIIIINDFGRDELYIQNKPMTFINKAKQYKFDDAGSGMNLSIIDYNQDNYWDIYITMIDMFNKHLTFQLPDENSIVSRSDKILKTNTFLIGNQLYIGKDQTFERKTHDIFEPGLKGWGWGTSFFDINNNGLNDAYITNGRFILENPAIDEEKNILMINQNNHFFYSHSTSKESQPLNSRAVSALDYNNDGLMDLAVRTPYRVILFENNRANNNHWVKVKLIGIKKNTHAIGSTIEVKTNKNTQKKIILAETGYLTQEPYIKHFGLKNNAIEEIIITWPNKTRTILKAPIKNNQIITIKQPKT
ncbi:hypothetical protein DID73_00045 [Candidatus Marinamargulisbacteria bacterium SCGC AG-343-K17]|nr:hypothetical protein DID73_00045 [Candidatus Marinamargulisbacteria bacterium SCGC AG-343-K17]